MSGGQRQRIGIARSLYRDFEFLILDEATSALDLETEKKVINNIFSLKKEVTIVMISHRPSTLKNCDRIIEINNDAKIKIINPKDL